MARFQWNDIPTKLELSDVIRLINQRMTLLRSFFTGIVRLESGYRITRYLELPSIEADPPAPTEGVRLYTIVASGSGKTELWAEFPSGAAQKIAQEP